jgi:flagellar hook assembly protein FlgD
MDSDLEAGFYNVVWRGDDNIGAEVASGTYFVRFVSRHREENRRVSLIK